MPNRVIVVNGMARSGKNTFAKELNKLCRNDGVRLIEWSTITAEKAALFTCLNRRYNASSEADRAFLSDLKSLLNKYYNFTLVNFEQLLSSKENVTFLVYSREPEEIDNFKKLCYNKGIEFVTALIQNDRVKRIESNPSDKNCENYCYDYIIKNNSSLEEFRKNVKDFYNKALAKE